MLIVNVPTNRGYSDRHLFKLPDTVVLCDHSLKTERHRPKPRARRAVGVSPVELIT